MPGCGEPWKRLKQESDLIDLCLMKVKNVSGSCRSKIQGAGGPPGGPRWALGRGGQAGWLRFKSLPLLPPVRPSCQLPLFPQNVPLGFLGELQL